MISPAFRLNLPHSLKAVQFIVFQRRQDGNLAQLRDELGAHLFDDVVLDDLDLFAHRVMGLVAFPRCLQS